MVGGGEQMWQLLGQMWDLTSLQEEPDVVGVMDLHAVAAGQSV